MDSQQSDDSQDEASGKRIVIVGAGVAGLSAARTILDQTNGDCDVTVLEARDRYGGRLWTAETDSGVKVDLGASWIHGSNGKHPITKLARKYAIDTVVTNSGSAVIWDERSQKRCSRWEIGKGWTQFLRVYKKIFKVRKSFDTDVSVREAIERAGVENKLKQPLVLLFTVTDVEATYATSINKLSIKILDTDHEFQGEERVFPYGYIQIAEGLVNGATSGDDARKVNVLLNHNVIKIVSDEEARSVTLTTSQGKTFTADKVIVAVPLGILKAETITFEPELSDTKRKAIKELGFGVLNKLMLEFDEVFWQTDSDFFLVAPDPSKEDSELGLLKLWMPMHRVIGKPVLLGFISGKAAIDSEQLSDSELEEKGLEKLRLMFGDATVNERRVVSKTRTRWQSDEYTRGSYSYPAVGNTSQLCKDIADPEGDCPLLYFAGEHTQCDHMSSVHGAYMSGERAAKEALCGGALPVTSTSSMTLTEALLAVVNCFTCRNK